MSEESSKPAEQSTEPIAVETPAAPSAPAPKSRVGLVVLLAAGAIVLSSVVSCGIGLGIGASGEPDEVSVTKTTTKTKPPVEVTETVVETQTVTVTVTPAPPTTDAAGLVTTFGPGTWLVGVDIAAGTYRTAAEVTEDCYWEINPSAGSGDILENDIPGGGIPTVNLTDGQQFNSSRCGSWAKQ